MIFITNQYRILRNTDHEKFIVEFESRWTLMHDLQKKFMKLVREGKREGGGEGEGEGKGEGGGEEEGEEENIPAKHSPPTGGRQVHLP